MSQNSVTEKLETLRSKQRELADEHRKLAIEIRNCVGVDSLEVDKARAMQTLSHCLTVIAVSGVSPEPGVLKDIADFLDNEIAWLIKLGGLSLALETLERILATDQRWKSELGGFFALLSRAYVDLAFEPNTSLSDAKSHLAMAFELAKKCRAASNLDERVLFSFISGFTRMQGEGKPTGYLRLAYLVAEDDALSGDDFAEPESLMLESLRVYMAWSRPPWEDPWMANVNNAVIAREYEALIGIAEKQGKKKAVSRLRGRMKYIYLLFRAVTWKEGIEKGLSLYQQAIELFDASSNAWYSAVARRALAQFCYQSADFKMAIAAYADVRYRNFGDNYFLLCCYLQMLLEKINPPRRRLITQYNPLVK